MHMRVRRRPPLALLVALVAHPYPPMRVWSEVIYPPGSNGPSYRKARPKPHLIP